MLDESLLSPHKQQLALRLDADVVAWLHRHGKGYQTRANTLLRDAWKGTRQTL